MDHSKPITEGLSHVLIIRRQKKKTTHHHWQIKREKIETIFQALM